MYLVCEVGFAPPRSAKNTSGAVSRIAIDKMRRKLFMAPDSLTPSMPWYAIPADLFALLTSSLLRLLLAIPQRRRSNHRRQVSANARLASSVPLHEFHSRARESLFRVR